jgi:hypothetical protein
MKKEQKSNFWIGCLFIHTAEAFKPLTPELNPSAQRC